MQLPQGHRRVIGPASSAILAVGRVSHRPVQLLNRLQHEPGEVVVGQPITQAGRHQALLLTLTRQVTLAHEPASLPDPSARSGYDQHPTQTVDATASAGCWSSTRRGCCSSNWCARNVAAALSQHHFTVNSALLEPWASHQSYRPRDEQPSHGGRRNPDADFTDQRRSRDTHVPTTGPRGAPLPQGQAAGRTALLSGPPADREPPRPRGRHRVDRGRRARRTGSCARAARAQRLPTGLGRPARTAAKQPPDTLGPPLRSVGYILHVLGTGLFFPERCTGYAVHAALPIRSRAPKRGV